MLQHEPDIAALCIDQWQSECCQALLDHKADADTQSSTYAVLWMRCGYFEVGWVLFAYEADVNIRREGNQTAFQMTTSRDHVEVAQLLSGCVMDVL